MNPNLKPVWFNETKVYPSKIICVGRNYVEHIKELNNEVPKEMVLFLKPNSAISDTVLAMSDEPHHFESELCFLVKNKQFVAVAFGFDLTKRNLQGKLKAKGLPWERAKVFNGAALFSKFVSLQGSIEELEIEMFEGGRLIQQGGVHLMIHKPQAIIEEVNSFISLQDGDIVMTGTPKGVNKLSVGSIYSGRISLNGALLCE